SNIDEVIKVIRASKDPVEAREELMSRLWNAGDVQALLDLVDDSGNEIVGGKIRFTETQARAILELRLQRLTGLERERIDEELGGLAVDIKRYLEILGSREVLMALLKSELLEMRDQFAVPRRTSIEESEFERDIEDLIQKED